MRRKRHSKAATLAVLYCLANSSAAFSQGGCVGKLQPLKPVTAFGCQDTRPACACAGSSCTWVWVCSEPNAPADNGSWRIPLSVQPAVTQNPQQSALEAQRIKNLRLQNQLLEENLRRARQAPDDLSPEISPPPSATPPVGSELLAKSTLTYDLSNGRFWKGLSASERVIYVSGARDALARIPEANASTFVANGFTFGQITAEVDRFYSVPGNAAIPILDAMRIVALKLGGASAGEVGSEVNTMQFSAAQAPERGSK